VVAAFLAAGVTVLNRAHLVRSASQRGGCFRRAAVMVDEGKAQHLVLVAQHEQLRV
jgi:hypothetical protein